jgi:acyl phosphate:glycerol-3-phosphate acyltransferase
VTLALIAIAIGAYLIGSIPSGLLLARLKNVDVRTTGSGNIGATNVARSAGKGLGVLTLLLDVAKGALPVLIADALELFPAANPQFDLDATVVAALGAVTGHVFPFTLGFRGGKGVATALGAMAALAPLSLPLPLLAFAGGVAVTRQVSVGSILAALASPFGAVVAGYPTRVSAAIFLLSCLILYRHRDNMARLRAGTEPRFGEGPRTN